jgi:hypothetical protein
LLCRWRSSRTVPRRYTGASGPDFWSWDLCLLRKCHIAGTTSQRRCLSVASSTAVSSCQVFCWPQVVFPKVLDGVLPALLSPCYVEGLFGLSLFFHRPTPGGAPAPRGPSRFCRWGNGQRCSTIQDASSLPFLKDVPHVVSQLLPQGDTVPTIRSGSSDELYLLGLHACRCSKLLLLTPEVELVALVLVIYLGSSSTNFAFRSLFCLSKAAIRASSRRFSSDRRGDGNSAGVSLRAGSSSCCAIFSPVLVIGDLHRP